MIRQYHYQKLHMMTVRAYLPPRIFPVYDWLKKRVASSYNVCTWMGSWTVIVLPVSLRHSW